MPLTPRAPKRRAAAGLVLLAVAAPLGCREAEGPLSFDELFPLETTLEVVPIEIFRHPPASIVRLPDGRYVLPETQGVWIHVVAPDGQGITRLGGQSPGVLGAGPETLGRFQSLSDVAPLPGGGFVASDRTSNVLTLFDAELTPEETRVLPETRSVWQLETLSDGSIAAAVAPRHPTAGGQVVVVRHGGEVTSHFAPDPIFRHNRWQEVSSTRIEALPDGRILAYWPPLPWARSVSPSGDTLGRVGGPSKRYKPPVTGPSDVASLDALREWYAGFTPLLAVESAGPYLVFQFQAVEDELNGRGVAPDDRARADSRTPSAEPDAGTGSPTFANLYDLDGTRLAADLPLPNGSQILKTNDRERLYLLREASPRSLRVEVRRPDAERARELVRAAARAGGPRLSRPRRAPRGRWACAAGAGRSRAARSAAGSGCRRGS